MTDELKKAFEAIAPELLPDCDVRYIPALCLPAEFRKRVKDCEVDLLIGFTHRVLNEKNDLLTGVSNILVSEIAARIKTADSLYVLINKCLPKPYPHINMANNPVFFSREQGESLAEKLVASGDKVELKKLEKDEIKAYFTELSRYGIEYAEIEPGRCKLRYKQNQLFHTSFDSISGTQINFLILKFIQARERNPELKILKLLEATVLAAIANSNFACMGITVKNNFEALLISDKRDSSKWIPCFTDTMEIQETYTTIPEITKVLMSSQVMNISFCELEKFMKLDTVSGVVINIGGAGLRISRETCVKIIETAKRNKKNQ